MIICIVIIGRFPPNLEEIHPCRDGLDRLHWVSALPKLRTILAFTTTVTDHRSTSYLHELKSTWFGGEDESVD
jgi:hypothetical protein